MAETSKLTDTQELTIKISSDLRRKLEDEASEYGQSVEDYVTEQLEDFHQSESPEVERMWWKMHETAKKEGFLGSEESEKSLERALKNAQS